MTASMEGAEEQASESEMNKIRISSSKNIDREFVSMLLFYIIHVPSTHEISIFMDRFRKNE